jgi:hypothetical protein
MVDGKYKRGVARGWIAIGDVSYGVLFSMGGIAVGGIAIGGLSLGAVAIGGLGLGVLFCLAGLAVGGAALGGLAVGGMALGGLAIGGYAAFGGLAIAGKMAMGGLAIAPHANDAIARGFMDGGLMQVLKSYIESSAWMTTFWVIVSLLPSVIVAAVPTTKPKPTRADWDAMEPLG